MSKEQWNKPLPPPPDGFDPSNLATPENFKREHSLTMLIDEWFPESPWYDSPRDRFRSDVRKCEPIVKISDYNPLALP